MFKDGVPIYQQVADLIAKEIIAGKYQAEDLVPSTNEIALLYRINPATAGKGVNMLVDLGIVYKRRGIGMVVTADAKEIIVKQRKAKLLEDFITPLVKEARVLGISEKELLERLSQEMKNVGS